jgi:hypothetical protein
MMITIPNIVFEAVKLELSAVEVSSGDEDPSSGITLDSSLGNEITYTPDVHYGIF